MPKRTHKTIERSEKNILVNECNCQECLNDARNMVKYNMIKQLNLLMPVASEGIVQEILVSLQKGDGETINAYTNLLKILLTS